MDSAANSHRETAMGAGLKITTISRSKFAKYSRSKTTGLLISSISSCTAKRQQER